jgi:hypothetical protein
MGPVDERTDLSKTDLGGIWMVAPPGGQSVAKDGHSGRPASNCAFDLGGGDGSRTHCLYIAKVARAKSSTTLTCEFPMFPPREQVFYANPLTQGDAGLLPFTGVLMHAKCTPEDPVPPGHGGFRDRSGRRVRSGEPTCRRDTETAPGGVPGQRREDAIRPWRTGIIPIA